MSRILFFSETYGDATFIVKQAEMISNCHEVLYLCNYCTVSCPSITIRSIPLDYPKIVGKIRDRMEMHGLFLTFYNRSFAKNIKSVIDQFQPEVVHLNFGYEALKFIDNVEIKNIPVIIHFRGYDASKMLRNRAYVRRLNKLARIPNIQFVAVCQALIRNLRLYIPEFHNEPIVIHSNTNVDQFNRYAPPNKNEFIFTQVSSFRAKKGHEYVLKAFHKLILNDKHRSLKLWLVGKKEGDIYDKILKLVDSLCLSGHVEFLGWLDTYQIKSVLNKSHAIVLHSITGEDGDQEGIPNALMEGMSMELPVVSSDHSGIPELCDQQTFSFLVEEKDVAGLFNAMAYVVDHWRLAPENRAKVASEFSEKQFIDQMNTIYQSLITRLCAE